MALTASNTTTYVNLPVNVIYQQTLLRNARPVCPYMIGSEPGTVMENAGTATIAWRRYETSLDNASGIAPSTSTSDALTEVATAAYMQGRTPSTAHFTAYTATLKKYGKFFIITEEVDVLAPNGTMMGITNTLAITAGRSLNILQRNVLDDNLTAVRVGSVASTGLITSKITLGSIDSVVNTIVSNAGLPFTPQSAGSQNEGSNPMLPGLWGFCHPDVAYDISKLNGFKGVETYAGQVATVMGEFGAISSAGMAVRFIQSPDATVDASAGVAIGSTGLNGSTNVDVYSTSIIAMGAHGSVGLGRAHTDGVFRGGDDVPAIQMIVKARGSGGTSDPFDEIMTVAYKFWHAGKVLNANWGRCILSGATNIVE